jgi:hypothetical protein
MKERQQRIELESLLDACKDELRESFRVIVELRHPKPELHLSYFNAYTLTDVGKRFQGR